MAAHSVAALQVALEARMWAAADAAVLRAHGALPSEVSVFLQLPSFSVHLGCCNCCHTSGQSFRTLTR